MGRGDISKLETVTPERESVFRGFAWRFSGRCRPRGRGLRKPRNDRHPRESGTQ